MLFLSMVGRQFGIKLKEIQTDEGGEFMFLTQIGCIETVASVLHAPTHLSKIACGT